MYFGFVLESLILHGMSTFHYFLRLKLSINLTMYVFVKIHVSTLNKRLDVYV